MQEMEKKWQEESKTETKGRYYHSTQKKEGEMRETSKTKKEEDISFGHTSLNSTDYW